MTKALTQTNNLFHEFIARATMAVFAACALAVLFYIFNVYSIVSRTVSLKSAENRLADLTSSVNALNAHYLELGSAITPEMLAARGLSEGKVSAYIPRAASTASLGILAAGGHEL